MLGNIHRQDTLASQRTMIARGGLGLRRSVTATLRTRPVPSVARPMRKLLGRGTS